MNIVKCCKFALSIIGIATLLIGLIGLATIAWHSFHYYQHHSKYDALQAAIKANDVASFEEALKRFSDINEREKISCMQDCPVLTPLSYAVESGNPEFIKRVLGRKPKAAVIEQELYKLLLLRIHEPNPAVAEMLLGTGLANERLDRFLQTAVEWDKGPAVLNLLISYGASSESFEEPDKAKLRRLLMQTRSPTVR